MVKLRLLSVAVLFHGDDLLMMKRSPYRTLSPGKWAAVGGHMEPAEISDPRAACLRETMEETGLQPEDLTDLELRYILVRLRENEIRQQFVYIGNTVKREVASSDEGELHWVPRNEILNRDIPFVFRELLRHYLENGPAPHLWMATAGFLENGAPGLHFVPVTDPGLL